MLEGGTQVTTRHKLDDAGWSFGVQSSREGSQTQRWQIRPRPNFDPCGTSIIEYCRMDAEGKQQMDVQVPRAL